MGEDSFTLRGDYRLAREGGSGRITRLQLTERLRQRVP